MGAAREATRSGGAIAGTLALLASACGEYDVSRVKASLGDAQSQYEVSERYRVGRGVASDESAAVEWLRRSADGGWPRAELDLGVRHTEGRGVERSATEAARWLAPVVDRS